MIKLKIKINLQLKGLKYENARNIGSFLGVIPGVILYVLLTRINFYGSIAAIIIYYGAVGGYNFLTEKLKKKDYDELQERESRFNTIKKENFSPFSLLFSVIPGIIGVYLAEVINFSMDIKAEYSESTIGEIVPFAMANVFSPKFDYLIYIIISCALIIISAFVLFYKSREMMKY